MFNQLWLVPALPFAGFVILALAGGRLPRKAAAAVGAGSVGLAALLTLVLTGAFFGLPEAERSITQSVWTWMEAGGFAPQVAFHLDALSLVMTLVVTFVGFLIHVYSAEFMIEEEGYSRFFAYMNLFVGMMLTLVLADNLLLLYLGWEGVGLCSFLLIGFWYTDPANGRAARKAFLVTRVGDTAMAVGLYILVSEFGTLHIATLLERAPDAWVTGGVLPVATAALLLGGAVGKSAQLPLQTWLPDAMAGPSPVSALIHAATMVTAGVYLIARTHALFELAPAVMTAVAVVGALTLLLAACAGLTQWDLKRVLAYSTISQIGYMFLALGVGAWSAAIFHFMTHAFFKALLFLAAGVVIWALHHEHDMFKMGGLRRHLPVTFWTFLLGAASLAALPLVTAGFYSKDLILWRAWSSEQGCVWLWGAGLAGALVTSFYTFRMVFLTFFGEPREGVHAEHIQKPGMAMQVPLVVLAVLSVIGGFVEIPEAWGGGAPLFSDFLHTALPAVHAGHGSHAVELGLQVLSGVIALAGIGAAWFVYLKRRSLADAVMRLPGAATLHRFWLSGWGFDWLYDRLFVRPYAWLAARNRNDFVDLVPEFIALLSRVLHRRLSETETGLVRTYAAGIALGAVIAGALVIYL